MRLFVISLMLCFVAVCQARNVTIRAVDQPAPAVVRSLAGQTGKNFVYPSELLRDMRVSVDVTDRPLKETLTIMFRNTEIEWKIKGRNIILKRRVKKAITKTKSNENHLRPIDLASIEAPEMLEEVVVVSRLEAPAVETSEIGARKLSANDIINTPVMFGESDVL